jgi:hypothetical protein
VRLRPQKSLAAALAAGDAALPTKTNASVAETVIEILSLRPALSLGIEAKP